MIGVNHMKKSAQGIVGACKLLPASSRRGAGTKQHHEGFLRWQEPKWVFSGVSTPLHLQRTMIGVNNMQKKAEGIVGAHKFLRPSSRSGAVPKQHDGGFLRWLEPKCVFSGVSTLLHLQQTMIGVNHMQKRAQGIVGACTLLPPSSRSGAG